MTNTQLFIEWGRFLRQVYGCRPDTNGNYPCDRGEICDRCSDNGIWDQFQKWVSES